MYDVIILGAGPAGITAAIYSARANLKTLIIDKSAIGGNPLNYSEIENYPGFGKISTLELAQKFEEHLKLYSNLDIHEFEEIQYIQLIGSAKEIKTDKNTYQTKNLIIATGSEPRKLNIPGEKEYIGKGVHYCAICDGPLYKDKVVAVIGGGNSACEEALGLSKICKKVYIVELTDKLNAEQSTIDKINQTENIEVYTGRAVTEIIGQENVSAFCMKFIEHENEKDIAPHTIAVDGLFPYVGMSPNLPTMVAEPIGFTNDNRYIYVNEDMETSVKGVYAIGDITNKKYRQVITAMSDGAIAAIHISKNI